MGLEFIYPAFILLVAGLGTFLASTLQLAFWARVLIWLVGVGFLAAAYWVIADHGNHYGLLALVADALSRPHNLSQSTLAAALINNWPGVAGNLTPMFDIMLVLAAPLAIVALLAFTPGQWIEKAVRPPMLFLFGAILGGFLALVLVAAGLGGYTKDRVYAGIMREADVLDGDTIRMGDVSLRLWGVDAPEYRPGGANGPPSSHNQFCYTSTGMAYACGRESRTALALLVKNRLVSCAPPPRRDLNEHQRLESFGRPVVRCLLHRPGAADMDLASTMAANGLADIFQHDGQRETYYASEVGVARLNHLGMWASAAKPPLSPDQWRNDDAKREEFIQALPLP